MARWRKRRRESSAMLFILVQTQAGPPAFALLTRATPGKPATLYEPAWRQLHHHAILRYIGSGRGSPTRKGAPEVMLTAPSVLVTA